MPRLVGAGPAESKVKGWRVGAALTALLGCGCATTEHPDAAVPRNGEPPAVAPVQIDGVYVSVAEAVQFQSELLVLSEGRYQYWVGIHGGLPERLRQEGRPITGAYRCPEGAIEFVPRLLMHERAEVISLPGRAFGPVLWAPHHGQRPDPAGNVNPFLALVRVGSDLEDEATLRQTSPRLQALLEGRGIVQGRNIERDVPVWLTLVQLHRADPTISEMWSFLENLPEDEALPAESMRALVTRCSGSNPAWMRPWAQSCLEEDLDWVGEMSRHGVAGVPAWHTKVLQLVSSLEVAPDGIAAAAVGEVVFNAIERRQRRLGLAVKSPPLGRAARGTAGTAAADAAMAREVVHEIEAELRALVLGLPEALR